MNYSLKKIAEITGGDLSGPSGEEITRISADSRNISQSEGILFLAIRGERHDGHSFIPDLLERGIKAFMVQELPAARGDAGFILVKDPLRALQDLAAFHRSKSGAEIIGITGSNGKTIVKEWIHQALSADIKLVRSPKSFNSQLGVPLSVLLLENDTEAAVFEAGISLPGEMDRLFHIVRPDIGIFTNIGEAHQEGFKDHQHKIREKLKLFSSCKKIIYCPDQELVDREMRNSFPEESLFTWSMENEADVRVSAKAGKPTRIKYGDGEFEMNLPFRDRASVENALHVIALMIYKAYSPVLIESRISDLVPVAMRMEMVKGMNSCTLVNDSYNSDLVSLSIALDYLNQQNQHSGKTVILSDIRQTGKESSVLYREVAGMMKKNRIGRFIGIGAELYSQQELFGTDSSFYQSTADFLAAINRLEFRNEAILIKGARDFTFERITQRLQEKNHRTILEIDLNAMIHNLNVYRSLTSAKIMVMVKALAYGSGSVEIANALQHQKVDYLCVAYVDEGISLREAGIHLPVLVMNPEVSGFDMMIDHQLEPEIYNFRSLFLFLESLKARNIESYPVHLKLETGMNRLGFREEEMEQLIEVFRKHPELQIRSVFSHLGASDEPELDSFTSGQIDSFERISSSLLKHFPGKTMRHILNSAGIERFPGAGFDMVRLGIGLFGLSNGMGDKLQPVNTLKSIVSQVKTVRKGESIGYARNYIAGEEMTIGIVPVGYADGLRRDLGKRGVSFRVKGRDVPVLGTLCMDMCMIDLGGTGAGEGDEVLIFGPAKPVTELAEKLDTIPYEILAGLSERIKRVYFRE